MSRKVSFRLLKQKFKFKVIRHFLITTLKTIMLEALLPVIHSLFHKKEKTGRDSNYSKFLPISIERNISKRGFVLGSLSFVSIYAFVCYFDYL
ncbi:MAG: hypothetical protein C5B43_01420 [Verrucomicrobia bacterium]|nr:MAG: hypothetical protein C5B43_01420 [Verrucomicrobiota bacterium]